MQKAPSAPSTSGGPLPSSPSRGPQQSKFRSFLPFYKPMEGIVVVQRGKRVNQEEKDKERKAKAWEESM
eukprot:5148189-Amphidinium_carterae.1